MFFYRRICLYCLFSSTIFNFIHADSLTDQLFIEGDNKTLLNVKSKYTVQLIDKTFIPSLFRFKIDIPETKVYWDAFSNYKRLEWDKNFTDIDPGSYGLRFQAFYYPFQNTVYGWKVAETTVPIQISDHLDDFIGIGATQQEIDDFTKQSFFIVNKTVNFSLLIDPDSILARRKNLPFDYKWTISGPDINQTLFNSTFDLVFKLPTKYTIQLELSTIIDGMKKFGQTSSDILIEVPVSNVTIAGNTFVENGSLLDLNVTCDGSSKFLICHDFSSQKSNLSCFQSAKLTNDCKYSITRYFPENGTKYVNIGIKNDVSTVFRNLKITIYKVGPKPSLVFVIIPLISFILVIIITVAGITHFIKIRRRMNATIEVATIENFGVYDDNETLIEKTFVRRVKDSFTEAFHQYRH